MKEILLALVVTFVGSQKVADHPHVRGRAEKSADAIIKVTEERIPEEGRRASYQRALFRWGYGEGGWYANPPGDNDKGAACGVMQVHEPWKIIPGATCEKVRKDLELGYRVGMELLIQLEEKCGSLGKALNVYSIYGATCSTKIHPLVLRRCKEAGVKCD